MLSAFDLAGFHALGAYVCLLDLAVHLDGDLLHVRTEYTVRHAVRMADVASGNRRLTADFTYLGHTNHSRPYGFGLPVQACSTKSLRNIPQPSRLSKRFHISYAKAAVRAVLFHQGLYAILMEKRLELYPHRVSREMHALYWTVELIMKARKTARIVKGTLCLN